MINLKNIRAFICKIVRLLYEKDLTDSIGGNISGNDGDKAYISPRRASHDLQWKQLTKEDFKTINITKEVCTPGYV